MSAFHHQDRSPAGIARSFADAGRIVSPEIVQALAARIERAGSWRNATATITDMGSMSEEDRWLYELVTAESEADNPEGALADLRPVLMIAERRGATDAVYLARKARAERLAAVIDAKSAQAERVAA